jgi:hypothetical protein
MWVDGVKELSVEDYPPWTYVAEMREGYINWQDGERSDRFGRYEIEWVAPDEALRARDRIGIRPEDF